jgi:eukaryotic-like serine/threonine-protein kinase
MSHEELPVRRDCLSRRQVVAGLVTFGAGVVAYPFVLPMMVPLGTSQTRCVYRGHTESVYAVAWSPDSTRIASVSVDNTLQIWHAAHGERVLLLPAEVEALPVGLQWSPTGRYIAFGAVNKPPIRVWDAITGRLQCTYDGLADEDWLGFALAWSPDGSRIASGGDRGTIQIWNALTGERISSHSPNGVSMDIHSLAWSPDGKCLASGASDTDNTAQVWSGVTGKHIATYRKKNSNATSGVYVSWSSTGLRIASSEYVPDKIEVWPVARERAFTYWGHRGYIYGVAWSPDGTRIASCSDDKSVQVWEAL